jgi:hypothetical protein
MYSLCGMLVPVGTCTGLGSSASPDSKTMVCVICHRSFRWGENPSLNCGHQQSCCSSTGDNMSMENHGGMISTEKNS